VETDAGGRRLSALEVTPVPGNTVRVVPKVAVLATGGIENARLLLASNRVSPLGVGNAKGLVGRFLMDHPRTSIGHYAPEAAHEIQQRLGLFGLKHLGRTYFYAHGYAMNPSRQRQEKLLNCAAYLSEHRADDDPWDALKRLFGRQSDTQLKDLLAAASNPRLLLEGLYRRAFQGRSVPHKIKKLVVDCLVEQVPDPDSRITLSERSDENGVPLPSLHWKISDLERRTVAGLAKTFYGEMHRIGVPEPQKPEWLRHGCVDAIPFADAAHPTGTTRMSDDANKGVVDADCKVHGVDGLFVAGSSVFPTASHANPTLMVAALSVRLADALKRLQFA
jgi:choline dehydrogenase-like flavoprotein